MTEGHNCCPLWWPISCILQVRLYASLMIKPVKLESNQNLRNDILHTSALCLKLVFFCVINLLSACCGISRNNSSENVFYWKMGRQQVQYNSGWFIKTRLVRGIPGLFSSGNYSSQKSPLDACELSLLASVIWDLRKGRIDFDLHVPALGNGWIDNIILRNCFEGKRNHDCFASAIFWRLTCLEIDFCAVLLILNNFPSTFMMPGFRI